jgi:hypothetical protein
MNYSASLQAKLHAAPEWVIITPVPSEIIAAQLTATYYQLWGQSPTVACYQLRPRHPSNLYFDSTATFATALRSHIQHDMDLSYAEAGPRELQRVNKCITSQITDFEQSILAQVLTSNRL